MKDRIARFARLLKLREHELDDRKRASARALTALHDTRCEVANEQTKLREAALAYRLEDGEARSAQDFIAHGDWLKDRIKRLEKAMERERLAQERVRQSELARTRAEREKRKVELVLEKLHAEAKEIEARQEQQQTDELAAQKRLAQSLHRSH